jgi:ABC-type transporter Mla subunit MlaD
MISLGVVVGAAVLTSGLLERRYDLHMETDDADGLSQDTRVILQGLSIGRVTAIVPRLDPETNVLHFVVTLSIREQFPDGSVLTLPKGTEAIIAPPPSFVGPTVVELHMPEDERLGPVQPGDTIQASRRASVVDALADIATDLRQRLEVTLAETRTLLIETTETIDATGDLVTAARPSIEDLLARANASLIRTEQMLETVQPKVGPLADSVEVTLARAHEVLLGLDSLTTIAQGIAVDNRASITVAVEHLTRAAAILEYFSDQMSRRPLRFLWGVTPPMDSLVPPDTADSP